ncbi:hypothetical protein QTI66_38750 [Variovorax sp. J22R133]|uniref:hypothetical protein n=1 Tax=Variovorax brevis TaxID=3053503 RepID=UPI0025789706|nr:hypothetical protein [Variovorax sp. J22R133]MDM0118024.1 hypothetical protein [Variovorax sp. J22R133]
MDARQTVTALLAASALLVCLMTLTVEVLRRTPFFPQAGGDPDTQSPARMSVASQALKLFVRNGDVAGLRFFGIALVANIAAAAAIYWILNIAPESVPLSTDEVLDPKLKEERLAHEKEQSVNASFFWVILSVFLVPAATAYDFVALTILLAAHTRTTQEGGPRRMAMAVAAVLVLIHGAPLAALAASRLLDWEVLLLALAGPSVFLGGTVVSAMACGPCAVALLPAALTPALFAMAVIALWRVLRTLAWSPTHVSFVRALMRQEPARLRLLFSTLAMASIVSAALSIHFGVLVLYAAGSLALLFSVLALARLILGNGRAKRWANQLSRKLRCVEGLAQRMSRLHASWLGLVVLLPALLIVTDWTRSPQTWSQRAVSPLWADAEGTCGFCRGNDAR